MKLIKKQLKHSGSLYAVCAWEEASKLFVGGADKIVSSWNLNDFENDPFSIKTQSAILNLRMLPNQKLFIGLFNGHFHVIDLTTKKELHYVTKHKKGVYCSSVSRDGSLLVLGTGEGVVGVWRLEDMSLLIEKKISEGKIRAVQVVGGQIWIGTSEGFLLKVDSNTLQQQGSYRIAESGINVISYFADKQSLLLGDKDAHLNVFSLDKQKVVFRFPAHNWPIYQVIGDHPEGIVSVSRDKTIKVWNREDLSLKQRLSYPEFKGHTHSINNAIYLNMKQLLVTVGDDKSICFWQ